ncbi:AmmeMemoRadiSam system protein A [Vallitalea pronyensis]|uniref:AmmeMemoRadiSam system protein A n=1 Tax=Vallitalea pronyensis TaxID=1348613 RepID=A0A8J8SJ37_9FIRM|nr:AmmeMemoRadiSam system protein A [Vallitalea pronyensis]QUI25256.1 AmmeMemoRadiSam system protein A [Vallitalea pronyensis]
MDALKRIMFAPHPPILIHEIGQGREREASQTLDGLTKVAELIGDIQPKLLITITPHGNVFNNGICILNEKEVTGHFGMFGAHAIHMEKSIDLGFNEQLEKAFIKHDISYLLLDQESAKDYGVEVALDHGCMVPYHFIDQVYRDYQIIHITVGLLSLKALYQIGVIIGEVVEKYGEDTVILASGDLSHALKSDGPYNYHPDGPTFDQLLVESLENSDYEALLTMDYKLHENAQVCGLRSFIMALGAVDLVESTSEVFSYEGPFGVGYLTGQVHILNKKLESLLEKVNRVKADKMVEIFDREEDYIKLARASINAWVKEHKTLDWDAFKDKLQPHVVERLENNRAGAFVSIHKDHQLRGCIGTIQATQDTLAQEIIHNAVSAASSDFRFSPVQERECYDLEVKVDILHEIEPIQNKDQLDVSKYGVIVEKAHKRGLLLPNLDGVDSIHQQINIAKQKAGIEQHEDAQLYRFEVERHEI